MQIFVHLTRKTLAKRTFLQVFEINYADRIFFAQVFMQNGSENENFFVSFLKKMHKFNADEWFYIICPY